jgi:hypothetical protein
MRAPGKEKRPDRVVRVENPVGSWRLFESASTWVDVRHGRSRERTWHLEQTFDLFCGIDWGSEQHRVCLMDRDGHVVGERWTQHSGAGLTELENTAKPCSVSVSTMAPRGTSIATAKAEGAASTLLATALPLLCQPTATSWGEQQLRERFNARGSSTKRSSVPICCVG